MAATDWYTDWFNSPYYHLLYDHRDEQEATEFIYRLIKKLHPIENSKMLDVACGMGRHSKVLAELGFDVVGIDLSENSIIEAKKSEQDNLHFFTHDMRLPFFINYFDFVFNFFTSFGYFKTNREHNNAIRTIAQGLKQNGTVIIDFLNVDYTEKNIEPHFVKQVEHTLFEIKKWQDEKHFYKEIKIFENNLFTGVQHIERVAKFYLADFEKMFSKHDIQIKEVYGNYNLDSYALNNSPRLIIEAIKIN